MANISYKRLRCTTFVATVIGGRIFNYDGKTANIESDINVLNKIFTH